MHTPRRPRGTPLSFFCLFYLSPGVSQSPNITNNNKKTATRELDRRWEMLYSRRGRYLMCLRVLWHKKMVCLIILAQHVSLQGFMSNEQWPGLAFARVKCRRFLQKFYVFQTMIIYQFLLIPANLVYLDYPAPGQRNRLVAINSIDGLPPVIPTLTILGLTLRPPVTTITA